MKKKILLLLSVFSLVALAGGIYLAYSLELTLFDFNNVIKLHHVENLREHLLQDIQKVEIDLYSQRSLHPESAMAIESHMFDIEKSITGCYQCHHEPEVLERFDDLRQQIEQYKTAISRLVTARDVASRLRSTRSDAHAIGRALMRKVETMDSGDIEAHHGANAPAKLVTDIDKAEIALYLQRSRHPESAAMVKSHMTDIEKTINGCYGCHHPQAALEQFAELQQQIMRYKEAIIGIAARHRAGQLRKTRIDAHLIGDSLMNKVEMMVVSSSEKLREKTEKSARRAEKMKAIMIGLIAAGPIIMIVFAVTVIRGVSRPVRILLAATRTLKTGDLEHRITGLRDEFGELAVAFNDMADALRATMRAIEESEKRYRLLFESAADAIFILGTEGDQAGKILQANQAAARMHGYSVEELTALRIQDLDTHESAKSAFSRMERIISGEWIKFETAHRRKDGTVFPVEVSAGLLEMGGRKFILATDRDVTERKRAEKELQRTERIRVSGELATGLAHEIKNPLAGIKVSMEALSEESYLPDEDREVLNRVIGEIKRIEYLMQGLLNFAHPPKPHMLSTDVNSVLETVASLVLKECSRSRDAGHAVRLSCHLERNIPEIMADPMQLKQIFMNLLLNAVDAMPEGGTVTMSTAFDPNSSALKVGISDTGRGIDSAAMPRIFDPFFTTKAKGTGLGLSITKRLVEEHGGSIRLANNADGGVTCRITLPVRQPEGAVLA